MSRTTEWVNSRPTFAHGGVSTKLEPTGFLNVSVIYSADPEDWLAFGQWLIDTFGEAKAPIVETRP